VVTANKQVLAGHMGELSHLASTRRVTLFYEGAVAGAIPIVRAIRDSLAADRVSSITGILNGTTNYILTEMSRRRAGYRDALRRAQQLGYAEADPSSDVEGYDAAYKISLLAGLCFGVNMDPARIPVEGVRSLVWEIVREQAQARRPTAAGADIIDAGPQGNSTTRVSAGIVTEPVSHSNIEACVAGLAKLRTVRARVFRIEELPGSTLR